MKQLQVRQACYPTQRHATQTGLHVYLAENKSFWVLSTPTPSSSKAYMPVKTAQSPLKDLLFRLLKRSARRFS